MLPSLHRVPRVLVPLLPWYCRVLRLPAAPPALLRFLRFAVPPRALDFAPATTRRYSCGPGVVYRHPQTGVINGGDRTSQVPGEPHYERALLFDPGRTSALGHCHALMLPSAFSTASAPARTVISGLNHTARSLAVYASQGGSPHHHARLASGWLASLSGRDSVPAGFQ
jgi:hypothetical protein